MARSDESSSENKRGIRINMCGIAGILNLDNSSVAPELLRRMTKVLKHRGPDDEGYIFVNTATGSCEPRAGKDTTAELREAIKHIAAPVEFPADLGFGHRRLSIIDLSPAGHQPMSNEDETVWIIHNGEVYNYIELKGELKSRGHRFRSNTDTEVILHSYEEWGVECLSRFNGMWAFAIWDGRKRRLFCARDRFGIKPLYYYFDGKRFLFASEIKALLQADVIERKSNNQMIFDYLVYEVTDHAEETFFSGIRQLRGGHYLEFQPRRKELNIRRYYDIQLGYKLSGLADEEYAQQFYNLFKDSIQLRLISDVPVGSCLSGGLDSSSIVCMVDRLIREEGGKLPGNEDIQKTFSARYDDKRYDEGSFIDKVVKKTSVDARYTYPTGENLCNDMPHLVWHQEEPFGSASIYAQWEVFKLIKQSGVKVVLDGQGGDELLAGYDISFALLFSYLVRTFQWRKLVVECCSHTSLHGRAATRDLLIAAFCLLPQNLKTVVESIIRAHWIPWLNKGFAAEFKGYHGYHSPESDMKPAGTNSFDWELYKSVVFTSIPALLRYEDKNSMAYSIESRVPFLDYRLVEFAFTLPWEQKIHRGTTKFVLRKAMKEVLPEAVVNRQDKIGFSTPEDIWLRTHLGNEVSEVINSQSFQQRPFFNVHKLKEEFKAHQQGQRNISRAIWRSVNLELWLRMFID